MPYGFTGVLAGAGSSFFAYIGFDGLSTAAEEAKSARSFDDNLQSVSAQTHHDPFRSPHSYRCLW
jgi:hypothetical protein